MKHIFSVAAIILLVIFFSMTTGFAAEQKQQGIAQAVKELLINFHRYYYLKNEGEFSETYEDSMREYLRLSYWLAKKVDNYLDEDKTELYDSFVEYVRDRMKLVGPAFSHVLRHLKEALILRLNNSGTPESKLDQEEVLKRLAIIDALLSESYASSPVEREEWKRPIKANNNYREKQGYNRGVPYTSPEPCPPGYGQAFEDVHQVRVPGAEYLAIHFQRMSLEPGDNLTIFDGAGREIITYKPEENIPAYRYKFSPTKHQIEINQAVLSHNADTKDPVRHISWSGKENGFWSPRVEGDLIYIVLFNRSQAATESGFSVDKAVRFDNNVLYSDLAAHYAPWIYQETARGWEQQD